MFFIGVQCRFHYQGHLAQSVKHWPRRTGRLISRSWDQPPGWENFFFFYFFVCLFYVRKMFYLTWYRVFTLSEYSCFYLLLLLLHDKNSNNFQNINPSMVPAVDYHLIKICMASQPSDYDCRSPELTGKSIREFHNDKMMI